MSSCKPLNTLLIVCPHLFPLTTRVQTCREDEPSVLNSLKRNYSIVLVEKIRLRLKKKIENKALNYYLNIPFIIEAT